MIVAHKFNSGSWRVLRLRQNFGASPWLFTNRCMSESHSSREHISRAQLTYSSLPCQLPGELSEVRPIEQVKVEVRYLLSRTAPQTYLVPS